MEGRIDLRPSTFDPSMVGSLNMDLIASLQSLLENSRKRVEELEMENSRLMELLSTCRCQKVDKNHSTVVLHWILPGGGYCVVHDSKIFSDGGYLGQIGSRDMGMPVKCGIEPVARSLCAEELGKYTKKKSIDTTSDVNMTIAHHSKRYVALKVMYFGQRFYGFASEAQMNPTVESELFNAFKRSRLLVCCKGELCYTRCGRTDKGVSSTGQVISLFLRSNCKVIEGKSDLEVHDATTNEKEIDYVRLLNKVLPRDIRIIGWSPAPEGFHARFSCLSREYKYFFWKDKLNIEAMELAGKRFIGEHDFRNFCKMDALNIHNYSRRINHFDISCCDERLDGNELWAITINGSAFLWHQVRCMVAVLFMIGQGVETPSIIDVLLDTGSTTKKPQYAMAPELPLVLHSCQFEGLNLICSSDAKRALCDHLKSEFRTHMLEAAIFRDAWENISKGGIESGVHKKARPHVPLMSRATEPSYEERRVKLTIKELSKMSRDPSHIGI